LSVVGSSEIFIEQFGLTFEVIMVASFLHMQHKRALEKAALRHSKAFFDGLKACFTANPELVLWAQTLGFSVVTLR